MAAHVRIFGIRNTENALHFACALLAVAQIAWGGETTVVRQDGSIASEIAQQTGACSLVFGFGLPNLPPVSSVEESGLIRNVWVTNGIRYTQTVLLRNPPVQTAGGDSAMFCPVLLVNIRGENSNPEYTEASVAVTVESGGRPFELELKEGFVWRVEGGARSLIAALEVPASGIKSTNGQVLRFAGSMPPSEKGSLTLKIPLRQIPSQTAAEWVLDLDFETELNFHKRMKEVSPAGGGTDRLRLETKQGLLSR